MSVSAGMFVPAVFKGFGIDKITGIWRI